MTFLLNVFLNSLKYLEVVIFAQYVIAYIQGINQLVLKSCVCWLCRLLPGQAVQIVGSNSPELQFRLIPVQPEKEDTEWRSASQGSERLARRLAIKLSEQSAYKYVEIDILLLFRTYLFITELARAEAENEPWTHTSA